MNEQSLSETAEDQVSWSDCLFYWAMAVIAATVWAVYLFR